MLSLESLLSVIANIGSLDYHTRFSPTMNVNVSSSLVRVLNLSKFTNIETLEEVSAFQKHTKNSVTSIHPLMFTESLLYPPSPLLVEGVISINKQMNILLRGRFHLISRMKISQQTKVFFRVQHNTSRIVFGINQMWILEALGNNLTLKPILLDTQ